MPPQLLRLPTRRLLQTPLPLLRRPVRRYYSTPPAARNSSWTTTRALSLAAATGGAVYAFLSWRDGAGIKREKDVGGEEEGVTARTREKPVYGSLVDMKNALGEIRTVLGEDGVTTDDEVLRQHGYSEWSTTNVDVLPIAVVFPRSTEEVAAVAKVCWKYRVPMIPYSGGSSLEGHFSAPFGGISIDFTHMDKIVKFNEDDMDVVVQPAVSWMQLNEDIKDSGLFFPVDPGPTAKIGGMVGTNCSGTNAVRYGTMKDWVVNLTVVLADGTIMKTKRRPRKSSAGYNLNGLFVGSEGTLGIITEITLKLAVIPQQTTVAVVTFPTIRDAAAAASRVMRAGVPVAAMEIMDEVQMEVVNRSGFTGRKWKEVPTLFFKFSGTKAGVLDNISVVKKITKRHEAQDFELARNEEEGKMLWSARKESLWSMLAMRKGNEEVWSTDVAVPLSRMADLIEISKSDLTSLAMFASVLGHIGDGNFHASILYDKHRPEDVEKVKRVVKKMVERALEMEGTCTGSEESGIGDHNSDLVVMMLIVYLKVRTELASSGL
ncbi:FAD-binding domain-containing protein [Ascodesmis nigricans]|uniref:D-lactate dehydrogenase (cytochrome) n=1 Tax=Ascodesmis nigricans TaxID=341454 RepID=A0A4S2MLU4_9PEZI|nr:FAD-binding domain-containing protein [Ascodesmis nigricans]